MTTLLDGLPSAQGQLLEDRDGRIWVCIRGQDGVILRSTPDRARFEPLREGLIHDVQIDPHGDAWVAAGDEILRIDRASGEAVPRTASFAPSGPPGQLLATQGGDVWCGGCAQRRRGDGLFEAVPPGPDGQAVTAFAVDSFGNVWGITRHGADVELAVLSFAQPHRWERVAIPSGQIMGDVGDVAADDAGFIWLAHEGGLLRVDPRSREGHRLIEDPAGSTPTALCRDAGGQLFVGFDDGSVRTLSVHADAAPAWESVLDGSHAVQALHHDRRGQLWVLAGGALTCIDGRAAPWQADWDEQPRMPAGNHDHVFARVGERLYTAGGKTFFGWPADEWVNLDHVWSYHVPTGAWRVEAPMLEPGKAYSGIAALDGEIWLVGGLFRGGRDTVATDTVEILDPDTGRSRFGPPLPRRAGQVVALTLGDRLYAFGGEHEGEGTREVLSIARGESDWRVEAPSPGPILQASGCSLDGTVYIAAGRASQCPGLFVFEPSSGAWRAVDHPSHAPSAPLCTAFDGEVWILGGRGPEGGQTRSDVYSPATNTWRRGPDIPLPVSWAAAADVDGRLLIAGGAYEEPRAGNYFNTDRVFALR